jgi:hypothetical protein
MGGKAEMYREILIAKDLLFFAEDRIGEFWVEVCDLLGCSGALSDERDRNSIVRVSGP